jgi:ribonuclease P protein component
MKAKVCSLVIDLEAGNEKNLSTKPPEALPNPRFPSAYGKPQWAQGATFTACEGSRASVGLNKGLPGEHADSRLPPQARLRRSREFRDVFAQSSRSVDPCFTVLARRNGGRQARLGLAVSRKHARRAIDRNRIKRIVRESFRQRRHLLHGIDIVVLCRCSVLSRPNVGLFSSLSGHWRRVRDQLCVTC